MSKLTVASSFISTRWLRRFNSRRQLEQYQNDMLKDHLDFLTHASPYFKERATNMEVSDISTWPIMNKEIMMACFNTMNTVGLDKDMALERAVSSEKSRDFSKQYEHVSVGLSSGTSGHRGMFIISDKEREEWAGTVLAKTLPRGKLLGHRVAFFLRADNSLYQTVASPLLHFEYFDIYKDMALHLRRLEEYQPTILVAPPSVLIVIADAVARGQLQLKPDKVISVAEVLESFDERRFKKVFKQKVIHQIYQCTEGFLGYTCERGTLHLNEDVIYFEKEYLDKKRFIPIVTDFKRKSQPIVRYRLNDVLVEKVKQCACGSVMTAIERIEGREGDVFYFKDSAGNPVRVFSDMIARCMIYASGFHEFRVIQTDYEHLDVFVDQISTITKTTINREFKRLAKILQVQPPTIIFKLYERDLSRKLRRIERSFLHEQN